MHLFEDFFRHKFRRTPAGYAFRQWGQEVVFTEDEYRHFIKIRRRVWNPSVWAAYLLVGVVAPLLILRAGNDAVAIALAAPLMVGFFVPLVHVHRKPNEVAQGRVGLAGRKRGDRHPSPWLALFGLIGPGFELAKAYSQHDHIFFYIWAALTLVLLATIGRKLWRQRKRRRVRMR